MMDKNLKSSVILSILSEPSKLGLWNLLSESPDTIVKSVVKNVLKTQDIIARRYSHDAGKASEMIITECSRKNIRIVTLWDSEYPELLREIHNPPIVLYIQGSFPDSKMVSIVGTRDSDIKSDEITRKISEKAAAAGYTIVSGMALGIDRSAHLGALNAGGSTVAVLPGGVDVVYPSRNSDLYRKIIESDKSALVSEYPPGIGTGQKWTFARRNRIISGLSETVIVVQAPLKSGAMITARYAVDQNRELLVCPGNAFDERYSGCNELIRQGASIFSDMNDLFNGRELFIDNLYEAGNDTAPVMEKNTVITTDREHSIPTVKNENCHFREFTGKVEIKLAEELVSGTLDIDDFIRRNNFTADEVNRCITVLEIEGFIARKGNRLARS